MALNKLKIVTFILLIGSTSPIFSQENSTTDVEQTLIDNFDLTVAQ